METVMPMNQDALKNLEQKVDRLIELLGQLQSENKSLRDRETNLIRERSKLLEKNEVARTRVEGMINRLKNLSPEG